MRSVFRKVPLGVEPLGSDPVIAQILPPPRAKRFNHAVFSVSHNEGGNLLFCDGHAKWQKKNAIRYAQFGAPQSLNPNLPEVFAPSPAAATASHDTRYIPEF